MSADTRKPGLDLATLWKLATSRPVLSIVDQGLVSAGNFAAMIMLTRLCTKAEYGRYALAFTIVITLIIVQQSLITEAYKVFRPKMSEEERRRYTGSTLIHQMGVALLAVLLVAAGSLFAGAPADGTDLRPVLNVLALAVVFILFREYARQVCFASMRPAAALAMDASVTCIQIGALALLAYRGMLSAPLAVAALGLGSALAGLVWLARNRGEFAPVLANVRADFVKNWVFARWIFAYAIVFALSVQSYPWLLNFFHDADATASYNACFFVVNTVITPLLSGLGSFLGPKAAHAYHEGGPAALRDIEVKASLFFVCSLGAFCVALYFLGERVLVFLSGAKYAGHGLEVTVQGLAQMAQACTVPANCALFAMERSDIVFRAMVIALAVTLTAGAGLVWYYGPLGAACGLLAGNVAVCVYTRAKYRRELQGASHAYGNAV